MIWMANTKNIVSNVKNIVSVVKELADAAFDIDTAMTNLYQVTNETDIRYEQFFTNACKNAKELGRTLSGLIDQTANWSKLGYSIDDAEKLAKISSIYANISSLDDAAAVSHLETAMKAFNMEASDAIDLVDKLNDLGKKYSTSSAGLGEGLSLSASALSFAGNSVDEALALLTAMTEITQNAGEAGKALESLSLRLRGYDEETESFSLDTRELSDRIADLTQTSGSASGIRLFTDDTDNTYKSTYELLCEISEIWDDLTEKNQLELLGILSESADENSISALISNMAQAESALYDSMNSSGSAYEEQERWLDSLSAKTAQFEASFQSLSNTIIDSDLSKFLVELGTNAVSALDMIIDKIGMLPTLSAAIGAGLSFKNAGRAKRCPLY